MAAPGSAKKAATAASQPDKAKVPSGKAAQTRYHNLSVDTSRELPFDLGWVALTATSGNMYYPFLPNDDTMFNTLLELRLLSPTQGNCINDKTFYSVGAGLQVQDMEFSTAFDRKINGKNQTIDDVLKAVFESIWQDGNKFIEVVRTEVGGKRYVHVYPHNNLDCRFEEPKEGDDPTHVLLSKEFRRDGFYRYRKTDKLRRIPIWTDNPLQRESIWEPDENNEKTTRTVLVVKNEIQGIDYYGLPTNFAGLLPAFLEYSVVRFNLDNFDNNMFLAGVLSIAGQVAQGEVKNLLKDIRKAHIGRGKHQRIFTVSSEAGISDTKFTPFNERHDGHFVEIDKHYESKIISANHWSKDLLDLKESSSLGKGGAYLAQLFKMKFSTVIVPMQQTVLNNFIFPLMKIIDEYKEGGLYDLPWFIKPVIPVSLEGILDINSLLTVDEGREEMGKAPLEDERGKKLITEVKAKQAPPATQQQEDDKNQNQNEEEE